MNLYGFAGGDPVNFADPFGLCPIERDGIPCGARGAVIGGVAGAGLGFAITAGCASVTFGICAAGGPAIIGASAGLGASLGGLIHTAMVLPNGSEEEAPTRANPDGSRKDAGQQYEEISGAQRKARKRGEGERINSTKGSKQRDQQELEDEARRALEELRTRKP